MADAPILGSTKKVSLDDAVFGQPFHSSLVHEAVRAEQAARRQGTHASRNRSAVSGGGAKPFRQKGTGRARQGSSRSAQMTGGGVVFGPTPRSYTFKVNRKERAAALRSSLSVHAARASIAVLDAKPYADTPSTKDAFALLGKWGAPASTLIVLTDEQEFTSRSFRNLDKVRVAPVSAVGVTDLIRASRLLITEDALEAITARASRVPRKQESAA